MSYSGSSSFWGSMQRLNIVTAAAFSAFAVMGLIMTGLASTLIDALETHQFMPLTLSLLALCVVFASSGTRDPRFYHPGELVVVALTVVLMFAHAFLTEVQDLVTNNNPWAAIGVLALMVVTSAIVAR